MGVATCKILDELQQQGGGAGPEGAAAAGSSGGGLTPLAACVEPHPAVPGATALVGHLLGGWWLARDRPAALAAVQDDRRRGGRRRSVVTFEVRCSQKGRRWMRR